MQGTVTKEFDAWLANLSARVPESHKLKMVG